MAVLAYWYSSIRAKELARNEGKGYCRARDLTFLDDTVVLKNISLGRNAAQRAVIRRRYQFEFTSDGSQRYPGFISLLGHKVETIEIAPHRLPE